MTGQDNAAEHPLERALHLFGEATALVLDYPPGNKKEDTALLERLNAAYHRFHSITLMRAIELRTHVVTQDLERP